MKCQICKDEVAEWAFQPFGPGEEPTFTLLGSHYRGFPVIKVGDVCKNALQSGDFPIEFEYQGYHFIGRDHTIKQAHVSLWQQAGTISPTDLNPTQAHMIMMDALEGPDLVALVFNSDLLHAFLVAPSLLEACKELLALNVPAHLENMYNRGYYPKDIHVALMMALAGVKVAMEKDDEH